MPRFEELTGGRSETETRDTVFQQAARVINRIKPKEMIGLYLGDTHSLPPAPAMPGAFDTEKWPGFSRYCDTSGIPELKELLVRKLARKNSLPGVEKDHIQITCGAIHGLYSAFAAILDPGEEVMLLSPHWHMAQDVVTHANGVPVDTAFYVPLCESPGADPASLLQDGLSSRTAAIYLNTPNNPTGKVLDRSVLEKVAMFAKENDLWIVSDEAYEDFIFTSAEHVSIASLPGMRERCVSVFTFSKSMAAAGYRIGYTVAEQAVARRIRAASTRTIYNAPTNNQQMVAQAFVKWDEWFPKLYDRYKRNREIVLDRFKGCFFEPEGSFYVFFNARDALKRRTPEELLEEMVRRGVAAVQGHAFGSGFDEWYRFCFVAVPEEKLIKGIDRLNEVVA